MEQSEIFKNLGLLKENQEKYKDAAAYYEKSLEIDKKFVEERWLPLANTQKILGNLYKRLSNFGKAMEYFEESLDMFEKKKGVDCVESADLVNSLGEIYW